MKQEALDLLTEPIAPNVLLTTVEAPLHKEEEEEEEEVALVRSAREDAQARWASLTRREREVCELAGKGLLLKQIAAELGTREPTVHAQRVSAFRKLGVHSWLELVRLLDLFQRDP